MEVAPVAELMRVVSLALGSFQGSLQNGLQSSIRNSSSLNFIKWFVDMLMRLVLLHSLFALLDVVHVIFLLSDSPAAWKQSIDGVQVHKDGDHATDQDRPERKGGGIQDDHGAQEEKSKQR